MNTKPVRKIVDEINQEVPGLISIAKQPTKIWTVDQELDFIDKTLDTQKTALFTCRLNKLYNQWRKWEAAFPNVKSYYAVKCNPGIPVIRFLAKLGVNFDCATIREIEGVISCGVSPDRIIYAHPAKHPLHLKRAKELGVKFTVVDCPEEIEKIKTHYPEMEFLVRLKIGNKKSKIELSDKFGATLEDAKRTIDKAAELEMKLTGICFHVGYYNTDITKYTDALEFAKNVRDYGVSKGFEMNVIDIGGGFLSYNVEGYNFDECAKNVNDAFMKFFGNEIKEGKLQMIAEPGTFYVDNVFNGYFKVIRQHFVTNEEGEKIQHIYLNDSYYSTLSNYFEDYAEIELAPLDEKNQFEEKYQTVVHGGSFDPDFDKKKSMIKLPNLPICDWLLAEYIGAYSVALVADFYQGSNPNVLYYMNER